MRVGLSQSCGPADARATTPPRQRLHHQRRPNGATATLTHDPLNRLTQQVLPTTPNPVTTAWVFDASGFLSSVTSTKNGTTLDRHTYVPDAVGNITQETTGGQSSSTSTLW